MWMCLSICLLYTSLILIKTDDGAQRAIHPLMLAIILDEDNLSPRLEVKLDRGRATALRKLALYVATEEARDVYKRQVLS